MNRWIRSLLPPALIVLAGLVVYATSLGGEFVLDDHQAIRMNPTIRRLWPVSEMLFPPHSLMVHGNTVEGRPLLNLSFALNYALGGLGVWGYHATNLGIHLVAGLLLYGVVRRTLCLPKWSASGLCAVTVQRVDEVDGAGTARSDRTRTCADHYATWLALVVALLWVVHPLQTEAVSYLSQRAESLVGMMYLLTLYLAVRGMSEGGSKWWLAGSVVACVLGMASKEVMVTAPVLVGLYDWMFVGGSWREVWRRRWKFHVSLMVLGWGTLAALLIGTAGSNLENIRALIFQVTGTEAPAAGSGHDLHWLDYARMQVWAVAHYLKLSIWPSPLVFAYSRDMAQNFQEVMGCALLVVVLMAATVMGIRRHHWTGFAGACFFLILAPTSSVVPLSGQTVAEHRMYLPLAAVLLVVVVGVWQLCRKLALGKSEGRDVSSTASPMILGAASCCAVISLGWGTIERNADYRTEYDLWTDTARKNPLNAAAFNNIAGLLSRMGRHDEAIARCMEALAIDPGYAAAHNNLGSACLNSGRIDQAITSFREAVTLRPQFAEARSNLGSALRRQGLVDEAIAQFELALRDRPNFAEVHFNLGNALAQTEKLDDAISHFRRALQLVPDYAGASGNLGDTLVRAARPNEAVHAYERALELNPSDMSPLNNYALLLATSADVSVRNTARAVELARSASQLRGGENPIIWHTLMVALEANGQMADAVQAAEKALSLALGGGDPNLAEALKRERDQCRERMLRQDASSNLERPSHSR